MIVYNNNIIKKEKELETYAAFVDIFREEMSNNDNPNRQVMISKKRLEDYDKTYHITTNKGLIEDYLSEENSREINIGLELTKRKREVVKVLTNSTLEKAVQVEIFMLREDTGKNYRFFELEDGAVAGYAFYNNNVIRAHFQDEDLPFLSRVLKREGGK